MTNISSDLIRLYLKEIGQYSLLTPDQEISYAKEVQQMMVVLHTKQTLSQQLEDEPALEEIAYKLGLTIGEVQSIIYKGQRAKQKMTTSNLRLVVAIAKKYQKRNLEFLDLIQEGALGLQRAIEKFDPDKGYKLSTYAFWWIRQAITRAIAEQSRTIRLPIHITEKLNKIKKVQQQLSQQLGRTPTTIEIAESVKLTPQQIKEYMQISKGPVSLDMRIGEDKEIDLGSLIPAQEIPFDEVFHFELLHQDLNKALASLTPIQQQVISLRYGLVDDQQLSLAEIGNRLNLSRERVRQIEYKALAVLRRRQTGIKDYLVN